MDASEQNPPCHPVIVHTYGLTREAEDKLFDRIADAAHANDETLFCSGGNECHLCEDERPEPDWRDVVRSFLKLGPYLLERRTTDGNRYWRYETNKRSKGGLRELVDVLHFPTESVWIIKLGLYGDTHMVSLKNPTPADVLTAACLVGLDGGTP